MQNLCVDSNNRICNKNKNSEIDSDKYIVKMIEVY